MRSSGSHAATLPLPVIMGLCVSCFLIGHFTHRNTQPAVAPQAPGLKQEVAAVDPVRGNSSSCPCGLRQNSPPPSTTKAGLPSVQLDLQLQQAASMLLLTSPYLLAYLLLLPNPGYT